MIRKLTTVVVAASLALAVAACNARTDKSAGTVVLSITNFTGLPAQVSTNDAVTTNGGLIVIGSVTLQNFAKDPQGTTSDLQSIELQTFEVTYTRADGGTRVPPPRVRNIFGLVPVNGTFNVSNLDVLGPEQLLNTPLSDLLFQNGGADSETGNTVIVLNVRIRFFGRTIAGDSIESGGDAFTLELVP